MSLATEIECGLMGVDVMRRLIEEIFSDALAGTSDRPQQNSRTIVRGRLAHFDRPVVRSIRNPDDAVQILATPAAQRFPGQDSETRHTPRIEDSIDWEPERWDGMA